ncbi:MAG: acyl-ACP--UDP-N-acetylglucosamine O-acyltransferase [Phycisphaerae bacterium]
MSVHPTAIIHAGANISEGVEIGPYCVIDEHATIEAGCRLMQGVFVTGHTTIGPECVLHPFAIVGHEPQDLKFTNERTYTRVGARNVIREYVQIHRGTSPESATVIGDDCYLMAGAHVGHNCQIGDHVIVVNNALLAGHVTVGSHANLSGNIVIHQFCRIGERAMLQGHAGVGRDIVPYALVDRMGRVVGINAIGLRRAGIPREEISALKEAFRLLFRESTNFAAAVEELAANQTSTCVQNLVAFLKADSKRGFAGGSRSGSSDEM